MRRLANSHFVDRALRGAALVVTDRRWAAPLSAAALGFGIFAGVAIGPGTAGTLATGAQQIVELPSLGGEEEQGGGGGGAAAPTKSAPPLEVAGGGGAGAAYPSSAQIAPAPVAPTPATTSEPAPEREPPEEAAQPTGQTFEGTVVHANPAAGSYALAIEGGELVAVHAPQLPEAGTKLSVPLRRLANGTFAATGDPEPERKKAASVTFRGTVTFADDSSSVYTVSAPGASLLVHVANDLAATSSPPPVGSYVTVTAAIAKPQTPATVEAEAPAQAEPACADDASLPPPKAFTPTVALVQQGIEVEDSPPSSYLDLSGTLVALCPDSGQLLLSADDTGESGSRVTLDVPKSFATAKLKLDDSFVATATVEEDGSLTLSGLASDERTKGADDSSQAQGDLSR